MSGALDELKIFGAKIEKDRNIRDCDDDGSGDRFRQYDVGDEDNSNDNDR